MNSNNNQSCSTCKYMERVPMDLKQGVCRRFPPSCSAFTIGSQITFVTSYPKVNLADRGCYEYSLVVLDRIISGESVE